MSTAWKFVPALTLASAMAISTVAFAQMTSPSTAPTSPSTTAPRAPAAKAAAPTAAEITGPVRASNLMKANVRNAAGEKVGDVSDLLIEPSGKVSSVILGIGGFLGIGERNVALDLGELKMMQESGNRLVLTSSMSREDLRALPEWRDPTAAASSTTTPGGSGSTTTTPTNSTTRR